MDTIITESKNLPFEIKSEPKSLRQLTSGEFEAGNFGKMVERGKGHIYDIYPRLYLKILYKRINLTVQRLQPWI